MKAVIFSVGGFPNVSQDDDVLVCDVEMGREASCPLIGEIVIAYVKFRFCCIHSTRITKSTSLTMIAFQVPDH